MTALMTIARLLAVRMEIAHLKTAFVPKILALHNHKVQNRPSQPKKE